MAGEVRVVVHPEVIRQLESSPEMRRLVLAIAEPVARDAARDAPKKTGAAAGSIHAEAELVDGAWTADVSWDRQHYYLGFHDLGSRFLPGTHFLELALDAHAHL